MSGKHRSVKCLNCNGTGKVMVKRPGTQNEWIELICAVCNGKGTV